MNADISVKEIRLETENLILRPFRASDLEDFYKYASQDGVGEMAGWHHHKSVEESKGILDSFIREERVLALCLKEEGRVIGSLGIEMYGMESALTEFAGYRGRELGFVLSREHWGKGLMTEAVKAVTELLFSRYELDFLLCGYYNFNQASKRVQEKCGFKPYRSLVMETAMGTKEKGTLNLLINPKKNIRFEFSHPETLIYKEEI